MKWEYTEPLLKGFYKKDNVGKTPSCSAWHALLCNNKIPLYNREEQEEGTVIQHLLYISYSPQSQEIGVIFTDQETEAQKA